MRFSRLFIVLNLFVFAFGLWHIAYATGVSAHHADRVVLVSFDGLRPDAINLHQHNAFAKIISEGTSTMNAKTVLPSVTLPSHVSMLTGLLPARHNVFENNWFPWSPKVKVTTVFQLVKRSGQGTAFICGKEKLGILNISGSIDKYKFFTFYANVEKDITTAALNILKDPQIKLLFVHYPFPDYGGHKFGWMTPQYHNEVKRMDIELKRLIGFVLQDSSSKTLLIVTADHGGHNRSHGSDSKEDRTIPWISWGSMVQKGFIISKKVHIFDTTAVILSALGVPVPKDLDGKDISLIWKDNTSRVETLNCCGAGAFKRERAGSR